MSGDRRFNSIGAKLSTFDREARGSNLPQAFRLSELFWAPFSSFFRRPSCLSSFFLFFCLLPSSSLSRWPEGGESHGTDWTAGVGGCCWAGALVVPYRGGGCCWRPHAPPHYTPPPRNPESSGSDILVNIKQHTAGVFSADDA